ncbi:MAG: CarD family transcriptional regulator [Bacteriovoracaceae bacterium]
MLQEELKKFEIGEYAVCPGHGVAQVCDIESREIGGEELSFYILKTVSNGMTVMVPTNSTTGIRALVETDDIDEVYKLLNDHDVKVDNSPWNRRHREYMAKVKTGSLLEIADVLRALFLLKGQKSLSFGEKQMLNQCRDLLSREISLTSGHEKESIDDKINSYFESDSEEANL